MPVSDEPFYTPGYRPPPRQARPGELLWTLQKDDATWLAELRFHGEAVGWEAQAFCNGELVIARMFVLRELAVKWAEAERREKR